MVDEKLKATLKRFSHPLAFVDFEAFNSGIPILPGSKPYQAIPFQWSVHLVQGPGQHTSHVGFLHKGMNDPRDRFVETLELATRSANGIVHYSPYELQLLKCMAEDGVPGAGSLYNRFAEKSLDLLKIIRENVYDINFQSSFSLKVVLASLLPGLDYSGLAVQDGDSAAAAYLAFFTGSLSQEEAEQTLSDLEKYCKYDTWAMARVFDRLVELAAD
ncbi:DUF2779 domain-containing protein [Kamptonema cortianum]|nr:DUF2779 domain-containing protein [Geitlerinema splendidum]MDK3161008.1 DUF2779 domain-containing protein [Kamptonema cortianum]